ncbi:unnamed protein product [Gongylonema pulchrum]|uniref:Shikimate_DH domain-containing protein n=1 Tax=Gongylonema pulchrum TaxID=637853 RepID=A0A183E531_9BILA|nr:unnamed protein product [Gongylonema pulchrum]
MGKSREYTAAVCRNGVTLGNVVDAFLSDAVAKIPFRKVGELAKAITLWDSDEKLDIKETILRKDPYNMPAVAEKKSGYRGIFAQCNRFVEATEKVRAEVNRSRGATKARVAIFGGAQACTLSRVLVESEHVAVKAAGKQLQFSNWSELKSSRWEMGPFTGTGIFLLDVDTKEQDVDGEVTALQKLPDVRAVIMAPHRKGPRTNTAKNGRMVYGNEGEVYGPFLDLCGFALIWQPRNQTQQYQRVSQDFGRCRGNEDWMPWLKQRNSEFIRIVQRTAELGIRASTGGGMYSEQKMACRRGKEQSRIVQQIDL